VTGDAQLAAKLPSSLRSDLTELASAPSSARTADVQKIAATALSGGYGAGIQQLAQQAEQGIASAH
jgi:peptidoglycan biosynthesis protein MviN/MurJ (putative lipid II flippase)